MGRAIRAALALFLCLGSGAADAAGAVAASTAMPVGPATTTPIGWIMFCRADASQCRPENRLEQPPHPMSDAFLASVSELNARINKAIEPVTDQKLYGVEERWTYPITQGDCEDYALAKRRALHEAGVPLADLLLTVVRKKDGEGHAVLTLRTTGGDFVLDNLDKRVRPWEEVKYTFVKRQSSRDPNIWLAVVKGADVAVGALSR